MRTMAVLALLPFYVPYCSVSPRPMPPGWSAGPALPEAVQEMHGAVLHGRIYIAGGFHHGPGVSVTTYRLEPGAAEWRRVGDLPAPRHHMPLAVVGDSLYAVGGLSPSGPVATLWLYDEAADCWIERAQLPESRGASAAVEAEGRLIVVGGMGEGSKLLDSVAIYDPTTNRWHHGAPIPTPRDHLAAAQVGERVYAIGGRPLDPDRNFNKLEIYDPKTDSWAEGPPMLSARGGLAASLLDGSIHTFGGETTHSVFEEHEVYDVEAGAWRSAPSLPTPRHGLAAAALGGRIYVIGGGPRAGLAQTSTVEVFNPTDCAASQCSVSSSGN